MPQTKNLIQSSPSLVKYWFYLANEWEQIGKTQEAFHYYQRALIASEEVFGSDHNQTKKIFNHMEWLKSHSKENPNQPLSA